MVFTDDWQTSQRIFQYLGNEDLVALSTVSRSLQERAEHTLYYNINLQELIDGKRIESWCLAILCESRRAHRVNILKFPVRLKYAPASNTSLSIPMLHGTIKRTFRAMINLKELFVFGSARLKDEADTINSILPSTFNNCEFRLSGLAGELPEFPPEDVWKLLAKHPDITYWVPGSPLLLSIPSFPLSILPNLREVVLVRPELTFCLEGRPIQSLMLAFVQHVHTRDDGLEAITALKLFKETLQTLVYQYPPNTLDWSLEDIVRAIAQSAPNLRTLTLSCFLVKNSHADFRSFADAIAGFHQLDTLALDLNFDDIHSPDTESTDPLNPLERHHVFSGRSPVQCRNVATAIMTSAPSLRRISFPLYAENRSVYLCYVRQASQQNVAWLDGFYPIDTWSWWKK